MTLWYHDSLASLLKRAEDKKGEALIINDAKTPSGRVHVGSLRGVALHDAIAKLTRQKGVHAKFLYELDDTDPMDGLPSDAPKELLEQMGKPLYRIPAPFGHEDMASYYGKEFTKVMDELGAEYELLRARDLYAQGRFNDAIDRILSQSQEVREIYLKVSGGKRPDDWHPFQVICEQCGKIGTTQVFHYDGKNVRYRCAPNAVSWAKGCGYEGEISPFDGRGKLPWKLEWPAKWSILDIDLEGAGKDHCTKGGSRDVAVACFKKIFNQTPPLNLPYEFFLVGGAKMSSSKGVGVSAREMADLLPPEALRFLMLKTPPKRTVNFSPDAPTMLKLFNELDRLILKVNQNQANEDEKDLWQICKADDYSQKEAPSFGLLMALAQLPHINIQKALEERTGKMLHEDEKEALERRLRSVRYWLKHHATDEEKLELQTTLPESTNQLSSSQKIFLLRLKEQLENLPLDSKNWDEENFQSLLFDTARQTPLKPSDGFLALYMALFNKTSGPKGGALLLFLRESVTSLLSALKIEKEDWVSHHNASAVSEKALLDGLDSAKEIKRTPLEGGFIFVRIQDEKGRELVRILKGDS